MKRPKFVMNAKSGMWRVGIAVIAVLIGLFVIGRWVILELVDLAMGTRSVTDLPARVSKASPALQSMFFELAGVRYEILVPPGATLNLASGGIDFIEIRHPGATRRIRMFRLGPVSDNGDENYARSESLPNGAVLRYNISDAVGGGSGGAEGELKGRLMIGTRILALVCHDQDEFRPDPYQVCVPYLHHLKIH
jgi:hypothetical protein